MNTTKLTKELIAAGIAVSGCNSAGKVWDMDGNEIQDRADVAEVIAAHDPSPIVESSIEERLAAAELLIQLLSEA